MNKWESYKKRIMYKKYGRHIRRYERCSIRIHHGAFMFRVSMDDRREPWLNDRKKFYSHVSVHFLAKKERKTSNIAFLADIYQLYANLLIRNSTKRDFSEV